METYASYTGSEYVVEEFIVPEFISASLASASSDAFVDKLDIPYATATYLTTPTKNKVHTIQALTSNKCKM